MITIYLLVIIKRLHVNIAACIFGEKYGPQRVFVVINAVSNTKRGIEVIKMINNDEKEEHGYVQINERFEQCVSDDEMMMLVLMMNDDSIINQDISDEK